MKTNFLSNLIEKISPSPTLSIAALAAKMKSEGKDIISLSTGEPDFDTAYNVKQAAIDAISQGKTKYTATDGIKELKIAIQQKFLRENNIKTSLENIIVSSGAKQIVYNLFLSSLNPEDEVIIASPYWVSYPDIVTLAGGKPIIIDTIQDNFKLTANSLEKNITSHTKWVIINSPNNPTGAVYTKNELLSLIECLRQYPNIAIMSDEIYEHIIYEEKFYSFASLAEDIQDRIVTVNGVSKSCAMTGWRIGYACGPQQLIEAMTKLQSQSTSNPTSISQYAAIEALNNNSEFIENNKKIFLDRRNILVKLLKEIPLLNIYLPQGSFYIFVDFGNYLGKSDGEFLVKDIKSLSEYILEKALVALVPGEAFGAANYLRFSYSTSIDQLKLACTRIKSLLSNFT